MDPINLDKVAEISDCPKESESTDDSTKDQMETSINNEPVITNLANPYVNTKKYTDEKSIPELEKFDKEIVNKFMRKFGGFSKPDSLTNKERKMLRKLSSLAENTKNLKKKYRAKRNRSEKKMADSDCKQRIAFDLSYFNEDLMRYVDMRMCIKQIQRCYSENRKLADPLQVYVTSVTGKAEELFSHNAGYQNWDVKFHKESFSDVFDKEDIVYLTSESENVIDTLDDKKVYIIGGLLDHNTLKGLSYNLAIKKNISHGRLPIEQYMNMKTLKVLPINHVYSLLALVTGGKSWSDALMEIIPQRRDATPKIVDSGSDLGVEAPVQLKEIVNEVSTDETS